MSSSLEQAPPGAHHGTSCRVQGKCSSRPAHCSCEADALLSPCPCGAAPVSQVSFARIPGLACWLAGSSSLWQIFPCLSFCTRPQSLWDWSQHLLLLGETSGPSPLEDGSARVGFWALGHHLPEGKGRPVGPALPLTPAHHRPDEGQTAGDSREGCKVGNTDVTLPSLWVAPWLTPAHTCTCREGVSPR